MQLDVLIDEICLRGKVAELPYSGKYPSKSQLDITGPLTARIVARLGRRSPFLYIQSNGWGVAGDDTPTISWGHERDIDDAFGQINLGLAPMRLSSSGMTNLRSCAGLTPLRDLLCGADSESHCWS